MSFDAQRATGRGRRQFLRRFGLAAAGALVAPPLLQACRGGGGPGGSAGGGAGEGVQGENAILVAVRTGEAEDGEFHCLAME
jgi:hypothetical protein